MYIRKIRGQNLASLSNFEISFDEEPLKSAGLFGIFGKTGAGKSTVLDALCLALYHRTPRLGGGGFEMEFGDVKAGDPRHILQRGTRTGFAEVDFVVHQGLPTQAEYRARWIVSTQARNARVFAPQEATLLTLQKAENTSDQAAATENWMPYGDQKLTSIRASIVKLSGMEYEEFVRMVLLPQNSFAEFVRASAADRAEILEKLTGTTIYSEIAKEAHKKYAAIEKELQKLQTQIDSIERLSDDQKQELLQEMFDAVDRIKVKQETRQLIERVLQWHQHDVELIRRKKSAETACLDIEKQWERDAPSRRYDAVLSRMPYTNQWKDWQSNVVKLRTAQEKIAAYHRKLQEKAGRLVNNQKNIEVNEKQYQEKQQHWRTVHEAEQKTVAALRQQIVDESVIAPEEKKLQVQKELCTDLEYQLKNLQKNQQAYQKIDAEQKELQQEIQHNKIKKDEIQQQVLLLQEQQKKLQDEETQQNEKIITYENHLRVAAYRHVLRDQEPCPLCLHIYDASKQKHQEHPEDQPENQPENKKLHENLQIAQEKRKSVQSQRKNIDAALQQKQQEQRTQYIQQEHSEKELAKLQKRCKELFVENHDKIQELQKHVRELVQQYYLDSIDDENESPIQRWEHALQKIKPMIVEKLANIQAIRTKNHEIYTRKTPDFVINAQQEAEQARQILENLRALVQKEQIEHDKEQQMYLYQNEKLQELRGETDEQEINLRKTVMQINNMHDENVESLLAQYQSEQEDDEDQDKSEDEKQEQRQSSMWEMAVDLWKNDDGKLIERETARAKMQEQRRQTQEALQKSIEQIHRHQQHDDAPAQIQRTVGEKSINDKSVGEVDLSTQYAAERYKANIDGEIRQLQQQQGIIQEKLRRDQENGEKAKNIQVHVDQTKETFAVWSQMKAILGNADGKEMRRFAQQWMLDALLDEANVRLGELTTRYRLEPAPAEMEFVVIDRDMGDERRSVNSLSGGEIFLISLAMALALSSLAAQKTQASLLLIDEGFGTLDPESLDIVLGALDALQAGDRKVGIVSHTDAAKEAIYVQIRVEAAGAGLSRVRVHPPARGHAAVP